MRLSSTIYIAVSILNITLRLLFVSRSRFIVEFAIFVDKYASFSLSSLLLYTHSLANFRPPSTTDAWGGYHRSYYDCITIHQCLDEIQQQYDALMADGILPASASALTPAPTAPLNPSGGLKLEAESSTVEVPPGGEGGEADPDLELDGDGEAQGQGQGGRVPR